MELILAGALVWFLYSVVFSPNKRVTKNNELNNVNDKKVNHDDSNQINDFSLNKEKKEIFNLIETENDNFFITGKAGTGKSYLLQYFKEFSKKNLVIVAPTGVAALNVGGQTIHSLFAIPPTVLTSERMDELEIFDGKKRLLREVDMIVIDEVSMVRADLMDAIDAVLRKARNNNDPFGGVQIVMFGDPYQLPPVVTDKGIAQYFADNYGGHYFFNAKVWKKSPIRIYELSEVFRQEEGDFLNILNQIRLGNISEKLLSYLNSRAGINVSKSGSIFLTTTNSSVSRINNSFLSQLPGKIFSYKAEIYGKIDASEFPTDEILNFKVGSQVMFLKNDKLKRWVNGTIGIIEELSDYGIRVKVDGITYSIVKDSWKKIKYYYNSSTKQIEEEVVSEFKQYPLRLAWAITIHKSQGQTYDSVIVDMCNGAFAHGQTYVALSRCRSLEGMYLKRAISREDIIVDPLIIEFMNSSKIIEISNDIDAVGGVDLLGTNKAYSVEDKRKEFSNAYAPWEKADDEKLRELFNEGISNGELCEIFGRNNGAIKSRIKKLGLKEMEDSADNNFERQREDFYCRKCQKLTEKYEYWENKGYCKKCSEIINDSLPPF